MLQSPNFVSILCEIIMENLVSSWYNDKSLPQTYVFPPDRRPGKDHLAPVCNAIPVIDLQTIKGSDRTSIVQQIMEASRDLGFFQVINHGVPQNLMEDTLSVVEEFFDLPKEDKAELYSENPLQRCRLYTSNEYSDEKYHLWRDNLMHPSHPLQDWLHILPTKPSRYRDVVGAYSVEVRKMLLEILEMISEGLGLQSNLFTEELTKGQLLSVNHYPPCPDPSLTLGLVKHCDPNLITALQQGNVSGLQVFKDGHWIGVEALPHAFVINLGLQLQILTNGKLKCSEHRAVTNKCCARTTVVTIMQPGLECHVEPAKDLLQGKNPIYTSFQYGEFIKLYKANIAGVLEPSELTM